MKKLWFCKCATFGAMNLHLQLITKVILFDPSIVLFVKLLSRIAAKKMVLHH